MQTSELSILLNDLSRKSIENFARESVSDEKRTFIPAMEKSLKIIQLVNQGYVNEKSYYGNGYLGVGQKILLGMFWNGITESIGYGLRDVEREELVWSVKPAISYLTEFSVALVYAKNHQEVKMYGEVTNALNSFGIL